MVLRDEGLFGASGICTILMPQNMVPAKCPQDKPAVALREKSNEQETCLRIKDPQFGEAFEGPNPCVLQGQNLQFGG